MIMVLTPDHIEETRLALAGNSELIAIETGIGGDSGSISGEANV